jgi:hypothetical protein
VIAKHSEEHLATSDRGIVMLRRLLQKQLEVVAAGGDPAGVFFDESAAPVRFTAGNAHALARLPTMASFIL